MSMVTQCPHCSTAFNVTPDQLFLRDGKVRCGHCQQVFDGLVHLTSLEALQAGAPPPPQAEAGEAANIRVDEATAPRSPPVAHSFSPVNWPMLPDVPAVPVPPLPLEIVANAAQAHTSASPANRAAGSTAGAGSESSMPAKNVEHVDDVDDTEARITAMLATGSLATKPAPSAFRSSEEIRIQDIEPPTRRGGAAWAMAATLAALVLGAQALHTFRSEAAAHFPAMKPALAQLCEWAHCTVPPLQRPAALTIQASDMLILDKAKPHLVQLIVTLQNQSALDVGFPAIDLVLNDRFDHALARRVFLPKDYLRGADAQKTVIAASVATTIRIDLDVSELSAGGFGLLLIPAPQT